MSSLKAIEHQDTAQDCSVQSDTARLRILATTDIHMQLLGHDYVTDQPTPTQGWAGIATLIRDARAEAIGNRSGCVLLDNGDMFQGTIIGHILAAQPVTPAHPLVSCFNALRYDAIGLGNHDLDFGLRYLREISSHLSMPLVSTNLKLGHDSFLQSTALISCNLPQQDTPDANLQVGILSILPAKTAIWNRHVLEGQATVEPARSCLQKAIKDLRARGAQVIILLAHMGIGGADTSQNDNALSFAKIPGIDAIIAGHTHRRFPGNDHVGLSDVDALQGTIAHRPTAMPGSAGSDLAVLDLTLRRSDAGVWNVTDHASALRSNTPQIKPDAKIKALCAPAHNAARKHLSICIGQTPHTLHNYFSLAMPTNVAALTARAKARVVRAALADTHDADTPLIASVAAHTAGGRGGPDHFLHVPSGPVLRRHIAGLCPYANQIWALRTTGDEVRGILEETVSVFNIVKPNQPTLPLINRDIPAFNFDTIFGIDYAINPTNPPGRRITKLTHHGRDIMPDDPFILTTNQFRAAGGGGAAPRPDSAIALRSETSIADALIDALAHPEDTVWPSEMPWSFDCGGIVQTTIQTAPSALDHLADAAHLHPEYVGQTKDGFAKLRLTL